jgi:outer membrane protein TolC
MNRWAVVFVACFAGTLSAADSMELTLPEAVRRALAQNRALKIARLKVLENEQKKTAAKADYFPEIKNQSTVAHTTAVEFIGIPAGAFGVFPNASLVPNQNILITQGNQTFVTSGTGATEPLTPLIRIRQANRIAASEVAATRDELKKAENEVALQVHAVYYGILIAQLEKRAAEQEDAYAKARMRESEEDVRNGNAMGVAVLDSQAGVLESEQSLLTIDLRLADLNSDLNELLGTPLDTPLVLKPVGLTIADGATREESIRAALAENPQIAAAGEAIVQAKAAVTAAKSAYIPDVSIFARQSYQNGIAFLVHNFGTFGAVLDYDVFDFGKRRAIVGEREARLAQAEENAARLKDAVTVKVESSYNKVERTEKMLRVATEVVKLRAESERIAANQLAHGVILASAQRQAVAANYKAQADLLQAQLGYLLARAELEQTIGRTPDQ